MDTFNISVTPEQAEYVGRHTSKDFGNTSEFFRDMLRERMEREAREDVAVLESTGAAPAGPDPDEIQGVIETQRQVRKERRARGA